MVSDGAEAANDGTGQCPVVAGLLRSAPTDEMDGRRAAVIIVDGRRQIPRRRHITVTARRALCSQSQRPAERRQPIFAGHRAGLTGRDPPPAARASRRSDIDRVTGVSGVRVGRTVD